MKNFYYDDYKGHHKISLKRGCPEWVNSDCPSIHYEDDSLIVRNDLYGWEFYGYDVISFAEVREFIIKSDKAFVKKYPTLGFTGDTLIKNFDTSPSIREWAQGGLL